MELVKGVPITTYCDQHRLTVPQRLELFTQVCQAVQHAHQKGIIHRDLKPSNVLVTEYDGRPVPKVIDFGLAKALQGLAALTERTLHTAFGAVVGTPLYMAPEQVGLNALDVDTRSDVYALGVLLYELLTGTTPLERRLLKEAAWDEVCRVIREEEPPRPSTRLSTAEALSSIAARRQTEPARLGRIVRGELDWIVMKALEKDRNRRYESANGFVLDVQRYLADEPVSAGPPSAGYRLRKFVRRNRRAVWVAAAFAVLLAVGVAGLATGLAVLAAQKRALEQAIAEEERSRRRADENFRAARAAVDRFFTEVSTSRELLRGTPGTQQLRRRLLEQARDYYVKFLEAGGDDPRLREDVARAHLRMGKVLAEIVHGAEARQALEQGRSLTEEALRADPTNRALRREVAEATWLAAVEEGLAGKLNDSRASMLQARGQLEQLLKEGPADRATKRMLAHVYRDLGEVESTAGNAEEAAKWLRAALGHGGHDPFFDALCHGSLARVLRFQDRHKEALREAETARARLLEGPASAAGSLHLAKIDTVIGGLQHRLGNFPAAVAAHGRARARLEPLARDNPNSHDVQKEYTATLGNNALLALEQGRASDARLGLREARRRYEKLLKESSRDFQVVNDWIGCCYYRGVAETALKDVAAAREALGQVTGRAGALQRLFPNNPELHNNLCRCWYVLGEAEWSGKNHAAALAAYERGLELVRELHRRNPAIPTYAQNVVAFQGRRGEALAALNRPTEAEAALTESIEAADRWRTSAGQSPAARKLLIASLGLRAEVRINRGKPADALADLDRLIPLSVEPYTTRGRYLRALALARLGRHPDVAAEAELLARTAGSDPGLIYNAACAFALAAADADDARKETAAKRALDLLRQAQRAGFFDAPGQVAHLKQDKDIDPIRQRDDFKQFLAGLEKKAAR
jgi:tetratricopeptide (TPR) repeat protein